MRSRRSATSSCCSTRSPTRSSGAGSTSRRSSRRCATDPGFQHVVITGRDAAPELIELADLVSEVVKVKHPMDDGHPRPAGDRVVDVLVILDGASEPLGVAPTSLERAHTPVLDRLAGEGVRQLACEPSRRDCPPARRRRSRRCSDGCRTGRSIEAPSRLRHTGSSSAPASAPGVCDRRERADAAGTARMLAERLPRHRVHHLAGHRMLVGRAWLAADPRGRSARVARGPDPSTRARAGHRGHRRARRRDRHRAADGRPHDRPARCDRSAGQRPVRQGHGGGGRDRRSHRQSRRRARGRPRRGSPRSRRRREGDGDRARRRAAARAARGCRCADAAARCGSAPTTVATRSPASTTTPRCRAWIGRPRARPGGRLTERTAGGLATRQKALA